MRWPVAHAHADPRSSQPAQGIPADLPPALRGAAGHGGPRRADGTRAHRPAPPLAPPRSYSEQLGKWIEVGNSGMFRPEMLRPMGLPEGVNVIAWGLGLER